MYVCVTAAEVSLCFAEVMPNSCLFPVLDRGGGSGDDHCVTIDGTLTPSSTTHTPWSPVDNFDSDQKSLLWGCHEKISVPRTGLTENKAQQSSQED